MRAVIRAALLLSSAVTVYAIAGKEGKFEYAIDAPWRIEPRKPSICSNLSPCANVYRIPIQISIHDVNRQLHDVTPIRPNMTGLAQFESVEVEERQPNGKTMPPRAYNVNELHEVERTKRIWPKPLTYTPNREICRRWQGQDCTDLRQLEGTSEWHATLFYEPQNATPANTVRLSVKVTIRRASSSPTAKITLTDQLRVHLGEDPLPRFGSTWLYGDLHYHSQGTDNDAESAYNYRGVLQAMAGIGLDFLFATEHASNSEQIWNIVENPVNPHSEWEGLRDMSHERFAYNRNEILKGPVGANAQVLSYPWDRLRMRTIPQIFLGGEIDAIPETPKPRQGNRVIVPGSRTPTLPSGYSVIEQLFDYGNGLTYDLNRICWETPSWIGLYNGLSSGCPSATANDLLDQVSDQNRYKIRDIQGLGNNNFYARQHLIYLPEDHPTWFNAFVGSDTSKYGGATKRLGEIHSEIDRKGVYFLAHPTAIASGSGAGRLGPDLIPYTDVQLLDAFESQSFLGLQFWNEDTRVRNESIVETSIIVGFDTGEFEFKPWHGSIGGWEKIDSEGLYRSLHHGAYLWDKMLLWGWDKRKTRFLSWLPSDEPRKVFMAGGSDAHGDLNYRREGYMTGTDAISDTALGKPRNLVNTLDEFNVSLPGPRPAQQNVVVSALKRGEFSVTDGPAVRIAIDKNRNGIIDAGDTMMGSVADLIADAVTPVLVEWQSTRDFGEVTRVDLYVGVSADSVPEGSIYAPFYHAVRATDDPGAVYSTINAGGRTFHRRADGYWVKQGPVDQACLSTFTDYRDALRKCPKSFEGTAVFNIRPSEFTVVQPDVVSARSAPPQRMYVRAFVSTSSSQPDNVFCAGTNGGCIPRFGYTNPIWARLHTPTVPGNGTR